MLVLKRPCPCGSGRTARDCCGRFRRLSPSQVADAYLHRQARQARDLVGPFAPTALAALQAEAATLPARCDLFADALLATVGSDVRRLSRDALHTPEADIDAVALSALHRRAVQADTPVARVAIAKAIVALREAGSIDEHLAAAALVELSGARSPLTEAALVEAAISVGAVRRRPEAQRWSTPSPSAPVNA
jgi:hypothetical protein